MTRNRNDAWTVVTGATGGLGSALIEQLIADGRKVIATARRAARITIPQGPGRVEAVTLDMEQPSTMAAAIAAITRITAGGALSGLVVNMAGVIDEGPLEAITPAECQRPYLMRPTAFEVIASLTSRIHSKLAPFFLIGVLD